MKTLHEIYDAIYIANETDPGEVVIHLTPTEFNALFAGLYNRQSSSLGNEHIEVASCDDITPWLVPKHVDGNKVGYVLGFNVNCAFSLVFDGESKGERKCQAEIACCTTREKWKPKLYKTIETAVNDCPVDSENLSLWTH